MHVERVFDQGALSPAGSAVCVESVGRMGQLASATGAREVG